VRISVVYSTGRVETGVMRTLDGQRRGLVVMCPWGQEPLETVRRLAGQLTEEEHREVAAAFGFDRPDGEAEVT
jgi:hypothetical protein